MAEDKKAELSISRENISINRCSGKPELFYAQESVRWYRGKTNEGAIPIIGTGASRLDALAAADEQVEKLKKILKIS